MKILQSKITHSSKERVECELLADNGKKYFISQVIPEWKPQDLWIGINGQFRSEARYLHDPTLTEINETIQMMLERME